MTKQLPHLPSSIIMLKGFMQQTQNSQFMVNPKSNKLYNSSTQCLLINWRIFLQWTFCIKWTRKLLIYLKWTQKRKKKNFQFVEIFPGWSLCWETSTYVCSHPTVIWMLSSVTPFKENSFPSFYFGIKKDFSFFSF